MTMTETVLRGLRSDNPSVRLRATMAVGSNPDPLLVDELIERCAIEPEFSVREMLTWALTRHPPSGTVPRLIAELGSPRTQARSQALHTLSKIGDRRAFPAITEALLTDADEEVARSAWRAAVALVPPGAEPELARVLATRLGRGSRETQLSLSRALIALGEAMIPAVQAATRHSDPAVRRHALATGQLLRDPESGFDFAIGEATRIVALGPAAREENG
jgi:HEAT repeat protein